MAESIDSDLTKLRLKGDVLDPTTYPCEVCKKWPMLVPIYQCGEGHVICNLCYPKARCPTCNSALPVNKIRNRAVEVLQPPLTNCSQKGCNEVFADEKDMNYHVLRYCDHIQVPLCTIMALGGSTGCDVTTKPSNVSQTLQHLHDVHGAIVSHGENAFFYQWSFEVKSKTSGAVSPFLACIGEGKAAVIIKYWIVENRQTVQLISVGDPSKLRSLCVRLSLCMESLPEAPFDSELFGRKINSKFESQMVNVTEANSDYYRKIHVFDAGPKAPGIKRELTINITKGFYDDEHRVFLGMLKVGQELPKQS